MLFAARYTVSIPSPKTHLIHVLVEVEKQDKEPLRLGLPVWTPGSYMVRDYSQHIQDVAAHDEGGDPLSMTQLDKRSWEVDAPPGTRVHFSYRLYAYSLTVRTNHVDDTHGFICSAATFVAVEGHEEEPCSIAFELPKDWSLHTPLRADESGVYHADTFDHLVDSPFEAGHLTRTDFMAAGKPHSYVFWGDGNYDTEKLVKDTQAVIECTADHYGGTVPYEDYMFIVHSARGARGGLEHMNSTVLAWDSLGFSPLFKHESFMRLVAHEYYHTWNVKRIRPRVLGPFDFSKENYTKMLWLHEGGTVYYEGLMPMRSGILRTESWLKEMAKSVHTLRSFPGRKHQTVGESSFNAWTKLYRRNEHSQNNMISYYLKGQLVCLCLDKKIREETGETKSLDDVMRLFYERTCPPKPGYLDEDVAPWIEEATGVNVEAFLAAYVDGLEPLPLEETLAWYGLELKGEWDKGGQDAGVGAYLGVQLAGSSGGVRVTHVSEEGPALEAGIYAMDEIVALDDYRVSGSDLSERLKTYAPGDRVTLTLFRRERLRTLDVQLSERPFDNYVLKPQKEASDEQKRRFKSLLHVDFPQEDEENSSS